MSAMPRLQDMLEGEHDGDVEVSLQFSCDEQKQRLVEGQLHTRVKVLCQRCLEAVEIPVDSEFTLGIVFNDDQARNLPRAYEPLMTDPEQLDLYDMVEEELLLSLPMFAYHDHCRAEVGPNDLAAEQAAEAAELKKPNPFSVLSVLKGKK